MVESDDTGAPITFLTTEEVAELLRTSASTVRYWRATGIGPPAVKVGRRVLYRRRELFAWLETQADKHRQ